MTAYLQLGHDSENLVAEKDLDEFGGIILSPINRDPESLEKNVTSFKQKGKFDIVFDPQLYFPRSLRGNLNKQPYFPSDLETADITSISWWEEISSLLADYVEKLKINCVASPVVMPKSWNADYFALCAEVSSILLDKLIFTNITVFVTAMIPIGQLVDEKFRLKISSILSEPEIYGYYLVFVSDIEPRREFTDPEELYGAMSLIKDLENTGRPVLVSHCSSDMVLFKAAGATSCASGKYFNLRRFTKSRYEEPASGGGQLPYWFEHSLFAFLRNADILRLKKEGYDSLVGTEYSNNYWSNKILEKFETDPKSSWLAQGWRQYLSWFSKTEVKLSQNNAFELTKNWLKLAEDNWLKLEDDTVLFEEPRNNGKWIRAWRQALGKFGKQI